MTDSSYCENTKLRRQKKGGSDSGCGDSGGGNKNEKGNEISFMQKSTQENKAVRRATTKKNKYSVFSIQ